MCDQVKSIDKQRLGDKLAKKEEWENPPSPERPAEAKAIQKYLKDTSYKFSEAYLYEKASYKQIQNEGGSVGEVKYKKLAKQAKELVNEILNYL
ncbi:hypothetical protein C1645_819508 [Glomus cerebriforme]|uniref:Uncharacterized protein n=1 Tax=Glomus cerebriforme TaxID=658196 RepID=A0A397T4P4_9GLOM|nr:hypothetical protein C1645_819508 [Glomus cerebriforme]